MSTLPASEPFIYGLRSSVYESCYRSTESLLREVGGNTGNLAFHHAIEKILGIVQSPRVFDWATPVEKLKELSGSMVIPCANQFGAHMDMGGFANKLKELPQKIVAIGLGVQADSFDKPPNTPEGSIRWVRELAEHKSGTGPNIAVRGEFSQKVIFDQTGVETVALGCPSLLISPNPSLGQEIQSRVATAPKRIMVLAAHHLWKRLAAVESLLANEITLGCGSYLLQSDDVMFKLLREGASSISREELNDIRDFCRPSDTLEEFVAWFRRFATSFYDVSAWLEYSKSFDFAIGARIHGVIVALQAGIPAVCLCHDSRTLELCQTMQVPFLDMRNASRTVDLKCFIDIVVTHDWNAFDINRNRLTTALFQFLQANKIYESPHLSMLAQKREEDK
ncbi:MAG: polysaccharide pyruvyl transferase family protein [Proteobacteria bacterium]|nr:polysaccharide pyruvyl transferase family protein [Pseudomonadota bacterium]